MQEDGAQVCTFIVFPIPPTGNKPHGEGRDGDGVTMASVPQALYVKVSRGKMILRQNPEQVFKHHGFSPWLWHSLSTQHLEPFLRPPASPFVKQDDVHSSCPALVCQSVCMGHGLGALFPSVRAERFIRDRRW